MNVADLMPLARQIAKRFAGDDEAESEAYLVLCELARDKSGLPVDEFRKLATKVIRDRLVDRRRRRLAEQRAGLSGGCSMLHKLEADKPSLYERLAANADKDTLVMLARWAEGRTWQEIQEEFYPDKSWRTVQEQWSKRLANLAAEVQTACR